MSVVLLAGAAACSDDSDEPDVAIEDIESDDDDVEVDETTTTEAEETTTTTEAEASSAEDAAVDYIESLGSASDTRITSAAELAAPGSAAEAYAQYQAAQAQAAIQGGRPPVAQEVDVQSDGSIEACYPDDFNDATEECITFDDFVATPDGLLTEFSVQGNPIVGRVVGTTGAEGSASGGTARLLGALQYNTQSGFGIALAITAGPDGLTTPGPSSSSYIDPSGAQFSADTSSSTYPLNEVRAGATATVVWAFAGGAPGGRLVFDLCTPDYQCEETELAIV